METYLYENKHKDTLSDHINDAINQTIDDKLEQDIFYEIAPFLSAKKEIGKDSGFFEQNRITINDALTPRERKTASYLAPFFKTKVAHNPKEIYRYLRFLGHDIKYSDIEVMAIDKNKTYNVATYSDDCITFTEYTTLSINDVSLVATITLEETLRRKYLNGFDKYFDKISLK